MGGALQGLRVLELADEQGEYAGKLLADLGAEVCKVEAPSGESSRRLQPRSVEDPATSDWFRYANTSKQSLLLDLEDPTDCDAFMELSRNVDLILETRGPGFLESHGLSFAKLRAENPSLVLTRISGFGQDGPRAGWRSSDLVATALSGAAYTTGWPDEPPMSLAGFPAYMMAGTAAASGSLIALRAAKISGHGECVDVSLQEVMASVSHVVGAGRYLEDGVISCREGSGLTASVPSGVWPARDGSIYLTVNRPAHWKALARWVAETGGSEAIREPVFEGPSANRQAYREVIDTWLAEHFARMTVADCCASGQERHIAITPLQGAAQVVADPHLRAREFFVRPEGSSQSFPGAPYRHAATPWRIANLAPDPDQGGALLQKKWLSIERPRKSPGSRRRGTVGAVPRIINRGRGAGALAGLRVLEFTAGMAGPWAGRLMAYHGAEVVKIESRAAADVTRLYISPKAPDAGISEVLSPWFTDWNAGKNFVGLDLKKPEGCDLAMRLAAEADLVIENFVPGAMKRLGLDFSALAAVNPQLIYLATSGFGQSGPAANYVSWGPNIEAVSGLAALSGLPERGCTITQYAYSDPVAALHGLVAVMAALEYRELTGAGQFIDLAQVETCVATIGDVMMAALAGDMPEPAGNRRDSGAPYGIYPCAGKDRWVAITVRSEAEWAAFCQVAGHPEWMADRRFANHENRRRHVDRLDEMVAGWTSALPAEVLMQRLQDGGVAAGVAQHVEDLLRADPQLAARDFFEDIQHRSAGTVRASRPGFRLTETGGRTSDTGRAIGADNIRVLRDWLSFTDEDIAPYLRAGVLEN